MVPSVRYTLMVSALERTNNISIIHYKVYLFYYIFN